MTGAAMESLELKLAGQRDYFRMIRGRRTRVSGHGDPVHSMGDDYEAHHDPFGGPTIVSHQGQHIGSVYRMEGDRAKPFSAALYNEGGSTKHDTHDAALAALKTRHMAQSTAAARHAPDSKKAKRATAASERIRKREAANRASNFDAIRMHAVEMGLSAVEVLSSKLGD
jgi:hypothetical protein